MRKAWAVLALLLPQVAWAGAQVNVDQGESFFCTFQVDEGAAGVGAADGAACMTVLNGGLLQTAASGFERNQQVPVDRQLLIEAWGVVVIEALVATEDCNLELLTDNTPSGAGSVISTLTTGPGATEADCVQGAITVNAANEACTLNNFVASIAGGGFWRIEWEDNDGGGANTCTAWSRGAVWLRGRLLPQ